MHILSCAQSSPRHYLIPPHNLIVPSWHSLPFSHFGAPTPHAPFTSPFSEGSVSYNTVFSSRALVQLNQRPPPRPDARGSSKPTLQSSVQLNQRPSARSSWLLQADARISSKLTLPRPLLSSTRNLVLACCTGRHQQCCSSY